MASCLNWLGTNAYASGDLDAAEAFVSEALEIRRRIGEPAGIALALNALGGVHHFRGDLDLARVMFVESLSLKEGLGNTNGIAVALTNLGLVERDAGRPEEAAEAFDEAIQIWERLGDRQRLAVGVHNAALLALDRGRYDEAARQLSRASDIAAEVGDRSEMAYAMADRVRVDVERGDLDGATDALAASLPRAHAIGARIIVLLALEGAAALAAARGDDVLAIRLWAGAAADRAASGFANMPADERLIDARMSEARERLDPGTVAAAWAEGQALTLDAAVEAAMTLVATERVDGRLRRSRARCNRPARSALSWASRPICRRIQMRRSRLFTLLGGTPLAALLLPSLAVAAEPTTTTTPVAPTIKLHCALVIPAGHPDRERVGCGWSAVTGVDVRAYRVWKTVDAGLGRPRHLLARVTPDKPLRVVDPNIRRGHTYTYRVVAIGTDGKRVGVSNAEWLRVGFPAAKVALNCAYVIDAARQGVACHWAKADRPGAARSCSCARSTAAPASGSTARRPTAPVVLRHGRRGRPVDPLQGVRPRRRRPDRGRQPDRHRPRPDHRDAVATERARSAPSTPAHLPGWTDERVTKPMSGSWWSARGPIRRPSRSSTGATCPASMPSPTAGPEPWRSPRTSPRRPSSARSATCIVQLAARRVRPVAVPDRLERARRSLPADGPRRLRPLDRRGARAPARASRDPADEVGERDAVAEVLAAMDRLSPRYQQALALRYLADLSTGRGRGRDGHVQGHAGRRRPSGHPRPPSGPRRGGPVVSDETRRRLEQAGSRPVPQPDPEFADRLEARLLAVAATSPVPPEPTGPVRSPGRRRSIALALAALSALAVVLAVTRRDPEQPTRPCAAACGSGQRHGRPDRRHGRRRHRRPQPARRRRGHRGRGRVRAHRRTEVLHAGDVATIEWSAPVDHDRPIGVVTQTPATRPPGRRPGRRPRPTPAPNRTPRPTAPPTPSQRRRRRPRRIARRSRPRRPNRRPRPSRPRAETPTAAHALAVVRCRSRSGRGCAPRQPGRRPGRAALDRDAPRGELPADRDPVARRARRRIPSTRAPRLPPVRRRAGPLAPVPGARPGRRGQGDGRRPGRHGHEVSRSRIVTVTTGGDATGEVPAGPDPPPRRRRRLVALTWCPAPAPLHAPPPAARVPCPRCSIAAHGVRTARRPAAPDARRRARRSHPLDRGHHRRLP